MKWPFISVLYAWDTVPGRQALEVDLGVRPAPVLPTPSIRVKFVFVAPDPMLGACQAWPPWKVVLGAYGSTGPIFSNSTHEFNPPHCLKQTEAQRQSVDCPR